MLPCCRIDSRYGCLDRLREGVPRPSRYGARGKRLVWPIEGAAVRVAPASIVAEDAIATASPVAVAPARVPSAATSPPAAAVGPGWAKTPPRCRSWEPSQAPTSTVLGTSTSTARRVVGKRRAPTGEQVPEEGRDFRPRYEDPYSFASVGDWAGMAAPSPNMLGLAKAKNTEAGGKGIG